VAWKITVRAGSKVERQRYGDLDSALKALEARARDLTRQASRQPLDIKLREFTPVQQVTARLELAGPERVMASVRAGVDVRGDGSAEAYLGRVRREVVEQNKGETPYRALRRVLQTRGG
jgi:hypothetical protein